MAADDLQPDGAPRWVTYDEYALDLSRRLIAARKEKGWSREQIAVAAGIAGFTYAKYERGLSRPGTLMNPQLCTLLSLAQVFDRSIQELLPLVRPDVLGTGGVPNLPRVRRDPPDA